MPTQQERHDTVYLPPLAVTIFLGFVFGLMLSYWFAGIFGWSPPLFWASFMILFVVGVFFLAKPKAYLAMMFLYYGFLLNGALFGRFYLHIPMARLLDEMLLAVPLAVILMHAVNRDLPRKATLFPLLYMVLAVLSGVVNEVPFSNALRVTLSFFKFYIYWYFARSIGPWSQKEKRWWFWGFVGFATMQFFLNVVWHRGITLAGPDVGMGSIGNAHYVGYVSAYALYLIVGRLITLDTKELTAPPSLVLMGCAFLIAYNMVFLTDTKHLLFCLPFAALPFFLYPRIRMEWKIGLVAIGLFVALMSYVYLSRAVTTHHKISAYVETVIHSGRGAVFRAIVFRLPGQLPAPLLGAGPGNFCSSAAIRSWRPLAQKYVLPHVIKGIRSRGSSADASVVGSTRSSYFILFGEFGLISALVYLGFWAYVALTLWRSSLRREENPLESGQQLGLLCCLLQLGVLALIDDTFALAILVMPIWTLAGIYWPEGGTSSSSDKEEKRDTSPKRQQTPRYLSPHWR